MSSEAIRDYIYLDIERARSFYSQLKGGLLESFIKGTETNEESSNRTRGRRESIEQKALLGTTHEATHILHDFMFTEIETHLKDSIQEVVRVDDMQCLAPGDYLRVRGRAQIDDSERLLGILKDFNELHAYIEMADELENIQKEIWDLQNRIDFENLKKAEIDKLSKQVESLKPPARFRKEHQGVPDLTAEMLGLWFRLLYTGVFEIRISPDRLPDVVFRSIIDRSYLREDPALLYAKHSTRTQAIWTMVGQVTAVYQPESLGNDEEDEEDEDTEYAGDANMRDRFEAIFDTFKPMEEHLLVSASKLTVVLTPLAVFQEANTL